MMSCGLSNNLQDASPSIRREWIEIPVRTLTAAFWVVSLHTEGVD